MSFKIPPGETLKEWMIENNYDEKKMLSLLNKYGVTMKSLNHFFKGTVAVTEQSATVLEQITNIPKQMWLNLQKLYDKYA